MQALCRILEVALKIWALMGSDGSRKCSPRERERSLWITPLLQFQDWGIKSCFGLSSEHRSGKEDGQYPFALHQLQKYDWEGRDWTRCPQAGITTQGHISQGPGSGHTAAGVGQVGPAMGGRNEWGTSWIRTGPLWALWYPASPPNWESFLSLPPADLICFLPSHPHSSISLLRAYIL